MQERELLCMQRTQLKYHVLLGYANYSVLGATCILHFTVAIYSKGIILFPMFSITRLLADIISALTT